MVRKKYRNQSVKNILAVLLYWASIANENYGALTLHFVDDVDDV
jgi:hypothetical protein